MWLNGKRTLAVDRAFRTAATKAGSGRRRLVAAPIKSLTY